MSDVYVAFEVTDGEGNTSFAITVGEGGGDYTVQMRTNYDTMHEKILGMTPDLSSAELALLGVKLIEISTYRNNSNEQHGVIRDGLAKAGLRNVLPRPEGQHDHLVALLKRHLLLGEKTGNRTTHPLNIYNAVADAIAALDSRP